MSEYKANILWAKPSEEFLKGKYSREHEWKFDGGLTVPASSSPSVVPVPWSNPSNLDPEEAFVASLASCHMLTFLYLVSKAGYGVERYEDDAVGQMTKNESGVAWISSVRLSPRIHFTSAKQPSHEQLENFHHLAHEQCFLANSVKTQIMVKVL